MGLPVVASGGRPNVGKSSRLNMIAGRRISIVEPTAGVTRDRIATVCEVDGSWFELVDTGGFGIVDRDDLDEHVERQIRFAVQEASLILFVVDARDGVMPLDVEVAKWLRGCGRPVVLLANKVDASNTATELGELPKLGFGEPLPVSAVHRRGEEEVKALIARHLSERGQGQDFDEPLMKLAIVGRRNVGKSTLINAMAGQERVIVSEIAGTTRDAVDVRFELDGRQYMAIDTAGVRKKSKIADDIEYYSSHRAELSIRRADVVLLLLDATADVGSVDKHLARYIIDQYKPCIMVVNKWDLAKERADSEQYGEYLLKTLPGLDFAPVAFMTAKDGKNVQSVVDLAMNLYKQAQARVSTAELNRIIREMMEETMPKSHRGGGAVKLLYGTQVATCPPTLILFVNDPSRVTPVFERFLVRRLREILPFPEVPIRIGFRGRRARGIESEQADQAQGKSSREAHHEH